MENENKGTAVKAEKTDATPQRKKTRFRTALVIVAVMVLLRIIAGFPIISINGRPVPMFSAERFFSGTMNFSLHNVVFKGRVLGGHVFQTEYGEIRLRNFAFIQAANANGMSVGAEVFRSGQASHNLVVEGIIIPENIGVDINVTRGISTLWIHGQEIMVSGIPIVVNNKINFDAEKFIYKSPAIGTADIDISSEFTQEYITLADSTQVNVAEFWGGLYIFKSDKKWVLFVPNSTPLLAKLPGESEFIRYSSITFGENWGGFISGEVWEGDEDAYRLR
jgi:hypothetical protein